MPLSPLFACIAILVLPLMSLKALKETTVRLGDGVTLKCDMSYHHEINWLKMDEDAQPKSVMVMGLKNDGALSVAWNSNETHYEGCVVERLIGLRIFNVSDSDLGMYFCAALSGKIMVFAEGIRLQISGQEGQKNGSVSGPETSKSSGRPFHTHLIIASALSGALLLMVVTIVAVHVKTNQKRRGV